MFSLLFWQLGYEFLILQLMNDMKELFIQYKDILKDLLRYGVLKTETLESPGLYNGRLGIAIIFYEYSRYSRDALYEQFADEILESVMELPDNLSLDLADGLCGIGWGITYLHRREFIVGTLEDMLAEIDSKILLNNVFDADCEIYLGARGIYPISERSKNRYGENDILKLIWKTGLNEF